MRWIVPTLVVVCLSSCGKKGKQVDPPSEATPPAPESNASGPKPEVTALFQFWDASTDEHVYSYGDGEPANWRKNEAFTGERVVGYVATKQYPDAAPLTRAYCRDRRHYFYLTRPAGATDIERVEDFHVHVWTKPGDGRVPVHACFLPDDKDPYFDRDLQRVKEYADRTLKATGKRRKLVENFFYVYPTGPAPVRSDPGPSPAALPVVRAPRAGLTAEKNRRVGSVAVSPDGKRIATASWEVVRLWDVDPLKERAVLTGPKGMIHKVVFSPDGRTVAAVGGEGTIFLWDVETQQGRTLKGTGREARGLAFSPDGKTIAVGSTVQREVPPGKAVALFLHAVLRDVKTGEERANWTGERASFGAIAFLHGDTVLAVAEEGGATLRDAGTGQMRAPIRGHAHSVRGFATPADGKLLATCGWDQTVKLWDASGKEVGALTGYPNRIGAVAMTPDGGLVVAANGDYDLDDTGANSDEARVWDVSSRQLRAIVAGARGWIGSVAITPDGKTLVTGGADGVVRLWSVPAPGDPSGPGATPAGASDAAAAVVDKHNGKLRRQGNEIVSVDLSGAPVSDADVDAFKGLKWLKKLRLDGTAVTDAGLDRLKGLPQLEDLGVVGTAVTEPGAAAFRKAAPGCRITWSRDDFVNALINSQYDLAAAVRTCGGRVTMNADGEITGVDLNWLNRKLTDETFRALKPFRGLTNIAVSGHPETPYPVTDAALAHVKDLKLENLGVSFTGVTDAGLAHVAGMTELKYLDLSGLAVTDAGLSQLKGLKKLVQVNVSKSRVTAAGAGALQRLLPMCRVLR